MNKNLPTNPLQGLIAKAAKTLPATTGKVAKQQERIDRRSGQAVILADISASMESPAWGGQRKIDIMRESVRLARQHRPSRLFVFSQDVREVPDVPAQTEGNTALHTALEAVAAINPGVTLVISDGLPDKPDLALAAARKFRGAIDVLYIGPETDKQAIAFMRQLASAADGDYSAHDVAKLGNSQQLLTHIAGLLK